jgi:two-component system catabolic regulation response regulator CreB
MPPSSPRILLVEDDPAIAHTVAYALQREGASVTHVLLLSDAARLLALPGHDLLLLDLGLPDGNGLDLCRRWRADADARIATLPVLMLTARGEEIDRVLGLEAGADDYLPKPFSPRELVARVRALLRRAALPRPAAPGFEHDEGGQRIHLDGHALTLTRLEYGLLRTLLAGATASCPATVCWTASGAVQAEAADRTVDTHIKTLRAKLREVGPAPTPSSRTVAWVTSWPDRLADDRRT